jgi:hypothetical protein
MVVSLFFLGCAYVHMVYYCDGNCVWIILIQSNTAHDKVGKLNEI